eukprot:1142555-Pelagomonas_calceolata.AAC.4
MSSSFLTETSAIAAFAVAICSAHTSSLWKRKCTHNRQGKTDNCQPIDATRKQHDSSKAGVGHRRCLKCMDS